MAPKTPLEGVRVLDFGWRAVAPLAVRLLGWGGAEVIRIESAVRHDGARLTAPLHPGHEGSFNASAWWNVMNSNKLSVSLNLQHPKGKELALRLVPMSDIIVENFSAGTMDKLGLGYDVMRKLKPDIIMASHWLAGNDGPWKAVKGHGPMAAAMAGMHYLSGHDDTPPISPGSAYTDFVVNPHHSAYALLAALHHKRRTGKGQYLDLAQYESIIGTTGPTMLEYTVLGRVHPRTGNRDYYHAPQGVYPCRPMDYNGTPYEHFLAISVATDEEWRKLCQVMGRPSLAADPRFATFEARKRNEDAIDPIVAAWTQAQDAHQAMLTLQKAGVAAGVVQNPKDLLENDPQLQARDHYREVDHPEVGKVRYDGPPFALSETPVEVKPAPLLGEHNEYVFKKLLKLSDEQITEGFAQGYIA